MKNFIFLMLVTIGLMASCSSSDEDSVTVYESSESHKVAVTMEEMLQNPGIYEIKYLFNERTYNIDLQINNDGTFKPLIGIKDYDAFMKDVEGKDLSVIEEMDNFGTIILYDHKSGTAQEAMGKYEPAADLIKAGSEKGAQRQALSLGSNIIPVANWGYNKYINPNHTYVTYYQHTYFRGRVSGMNIDNKSSEILLGNIRVWTYKSFFDLNDFNDQASSLEVSFEDGLSDDIGVPEIWVIMYEHVNFEGSSFSAVFKRRDGKVQSIPDFTRLNLWKWWRPWNTWNDNVSSSTTRFCAYSR